jgi:hypothetical protein
MIEVSAEMDNQQSKQAQPEVETIKRAAPLAQTELQVVQAALLISEQEPGPDVQLQQQLKRKRVKRKQLKRKRIKKKLLRRKLNKRELLTESRERKLRNAKADLACVKL